MSLTDKRSVWHSQSWKLPATFPNWVRFQKFWKADFSIAGTIQLHCNKVFHLPGVPTALLLFDSSDRCSFCPRVLVPVFLSRFRFTRVQSSVYIYTISVKYFLLFTLITVLFILVSYLHLSTDFTDTSPIDLTLLITWFAYSLIELF